MRNPQPRRSLIVGAVVALLAPSVAFVPAHHRPTVPFLARGFPSSLTQCFQSTADDEAMGLNELQTLLRDAVQRQDYVEAGQLSDQLFVRLYKDDMPQNDQEKRMKRKRMSWRGLGAAPWLVDRLDSLNYTFPTTIQINTMEAVNKILNATDDMLESLSLEERVEALMTDNDNMGIVVSGSTGSGKTLSFLVPLLSTLSDSLFTRQRIRVGAEENVGDTTGDLLERISVVTSPVMRSNSRRSVRGGAIATGASLATLGKSGKDVKSPLALIVVPTRELGIQTAMLLYELVGGSVKKEATDIRGKANMFKYKGPKGIRIGCVLEDDEAEFGLKLQTDVAITMPQYLGKLIEDEDLIPSKLRVLIFDEADLALEETNAKDLKALFEKDNEDREYNRLTFLVGASVTESLGNLAVRSNILPEGKSYIASATRHAQLLADRDLDSQDDSAEQTLGMVGAPPKAASLKDLNVCLDPGLRHRRARVGNEAGLLVLTRLLRKELKDYEAKQKENPLLARPRVVVFFPNEEMAKKSIAPLRDALWGDHKLCVLLPKTGVNPLQMMEQFKSNQTTVMLATPNSVRGLDFPSVSHVYTLYLPMDDPREYVHLAGRVGRVGQMGSVKGGGGQVISVLRDDDAEKMDVLAAELGFDFTDIKIDQGEDMFARTEDGDVDLDSVDVEKMRRYLEDTLNFLSTDDSDEDASTASGATVDVDYEEEDIDDEDGDEANVEEGDWQ
jgi:superfamily II DNA/RNA helicase